MSDENHDPGAARPAGGGAARERAAGRTTSRIIGVGIVVAAVLAIVVAVTRDEGLFSTLGIADPNPEPGECLVDSVDKDVVDCDSAEATLRVLAVVDIGDDPREECRDHPETDGVVLTTNNSGKALCVQDLRADDTATGAGAGAAPAAQPDHDFAVGDCVGTLDGVRQKVSCDAEDARPVLADVSDRDQDACLEIEGATQGFRVIGAGETKIFCVGDPVAN